MCTVSWLHDEQGYQVFFNRDERHTRAQGLAPCAARSGSLTVIAPSDAEHGGTWLGVNSAGLAVALVNDYPAPAAPLHPAAGSRSRGLLTAALLKCAWPEQALQRLARHALGPYRPFKLLLFAPGRATTMLHWNGSQRRVLLDADTCMPLVSSSIDQPGVQRIRPAVLAGLAAARDSCDRQTLYDFHRSHAPAGGAYAACLHRDDAATVSFSWVQVCPRQICVTYFPAAPCALAPYALAQLAQAAGVTRLCIERGAR